MPDALSPASRVHHNLVRDNTFGVELAAAEQPSRVDHNCFRDNDVCRRQPALPPRRRPHRRQHHVPAPRSIAFEIGWDLRRHAPTCRIDHNVSSTTRRSVYVEYVVRPESRRRVRGVTTCGRPASHRRGVSGNEIRAGVGVWRNETPTSTWSTTRSTRSRRDRRGRVRSSSVRATRHRVGVRCLGDMLVPPHNTGDAASRRGQHRVGPERPPGSGVVVSPIGEAGSSCGETSSAATRTASWWGRTTTAGVTGNVADGNGSTASGSQLPGDGQRADRQHRTGQRRPTPVTRELDGQHDGARTSGSARRV